MDYKFAMTVILVVTFVAFITLAAKLVTRRANRIERERVAAERQDVIDSARGMLRPYKGERRTHMNPCFAAPYGEDRPNLQTVPKGHEDNASRMFHSLDGAKPGQRSIPVLRAPARNDADDALLVASLLYATVGTGPTTDRISSRDSGYGDDLGAEALPAGTNLNDFTRTGTYRVDIPETNYPTESSSSRVESAPESPTRYRSEPTYDSSPSFSSSDSYSSSSDSGSSFSSSD